MILRSIKVEGWGCFAAAVEVGPFAEGLNIVHGPNGIGKSTLMMALVRGLFDNHSVGGEQIKAFKPWGRSLNPKVIIQFEHDTTEYELSKQFLGSAAAMLSRMENGQYVPLAEGRNADEQARRLLSGEAPGRGVTDERHWGLAQVLWSKQGNLQLSELSTGTRTTIQDALGSQVAGPGAEALENKIADAFFQIHTQTGKLKGGAAAPAIVGLQKQLTDAEARHNEVRDKLDAFDDAGHRIQDLRHQTDQARHNTEELAERLKQLREQVDAYKELVNQHKVHQQEVKTAEEKYNNLDGRIKNIKSTRDELKTAQQNLKRLRDDAPTQAKLVDQCRIASKEVKQKVDKVRAQRSEVTTARQTATHASRFASAQKTVAEADKLIAQVETEETDLDKLHQQRNKLIAPDKKVLAAIKKTVRKRDEARLKLDAAVITVRIRPVHETEIDITTAEEIGTTEIPAGDEQEIKGSPDVAFTIPGVASIEATGPTESIDELRDQWEKAIEQLDELTSGFGTDDLDRLEQIHTKASESDSKISKSQVKVETLLDGRELEEIRADQARANGTLDEILAEHPAWKDGSPNPDSLERQANEIEKSFTTKIDEAEAGKDRADGALQAAEKNQTSHNAAIENADRQVESINTRLNTLCDDDQDDTQRENQLTDIAIDLKAVRGELAKIEDKIKEFGDDPSTSVNVLEGQLEGLRSDATEAAKKLNHEEGRVQQILSEAPYSALAIEEENIDRLQQDIAREQLQIDAIRLLYETLSDKKRAVLQSVIGPVRTRANQTLQRIAGGRFEGIEFNDNFLPTAVAPRNIDDAVSLDQLSGGEREQLYFAVRLAMADVAFGDQRQLVVLDDVFTYTDTTRLVRITTILDEAAERFQIVLLTCHPERYRGLPRAEFFDLEAATQEFTS